MSKIGKTHYKDITVISILKKKAEKCIESWRHPEQRSDISLIASKFRLEIEFEEESRSSGTLPMIVKGPIIVN